MTVTKITKIDFLAVLSGLEVTRAPSILIDFGFILVQLV
jgi:hypothetical protein